MKKIRFRTIFVVIFSALLLGAAGSAAAQIDRTPMKRLISPATVRGYVGGEAHDSYVIRAKKGQSMTVEISWRSRGDNRAEFSVSRSSDFFRGGAVKFGVKSAGGKRWRGKIPKTGSYFVYVVAHPTANYTLRGNVK